MPTASGSVSKLGKGGILLLLCGADSYSRVVPATVSVFAKKKNFYGVYVTVNKPYSALAENFRKDKIGTERMFFIDAVTKMVGGVSAPSKNFLTIQSPQFLTEMSIAVSQAMDALPKGERFFILDSVSSLLIYNSPGTVARFLHFLSGKLREWGARGVFLAVDREVDALLPYITQFVDETVHVR